MPFSENKIFKENYEKYKYLFKEIRVKSKTILLREGEISRKIFFIKEGCLRMAFNNKGKDITFQFFFENQPVASIESFMSEQPSQFSLETIEQSIIKVLQKKDFEKIMREVPELKDALHELMFERLGRYSKLFLSFIKDTPELRYIDLLHSEPHILQRVPQHYIASYLGITPVSLSRIRNKLLKK
jgi:CRP-like cAMP-binding protein